MTTGEFVLRPGCHLKQERGSWMLIDELCQVKMPINESAYDLLSTLEEKTTFSDEEMEFLNGLSKLLFLTSKSQMERALAIAQTFKPTPEGDYRGALL